MLPGGLRVWVASAPVNMSRSIDGLAKIVVEKFEKDPRVDGVFVFVNSKRDRVKLLWKDQSGWCLLYKRLDARLVVRSIGVSPSSSSLVMIDGRTLATLLEGVARVQGERAKDVAKKSRDRALSMSRCLLKGREFSGRCRRRIASS